MRQNTDILTGRKEYVMTEAELRRYRYKVIKEHKEKKKVQKINTARKVLFTIGEGLLFTSMVFGTFAIGLYLS